MLVGWWVKATDGNWEEVWEEQSGPLLEMATVGALDVQWAAMLDGWSVKATVAELVVQWEVQTG